MTAAPVTPVRGALAHAAALVDLGARTCEAYGMPDLAARLVTRGRALAGAAVHVLVVGDFKRGKSSLVNALVGAHACPVDDNVATAVPTYVRYGPRALAELMFDGDPPRREPVPIDDVRHVVFERKAEPSGSRSGTERISGVEIQLPCEVLAEGLVVVDTPGVGGLGSTHAAGSLAAISLADAVLFVTDAEQPLNRNELEFLRHARSLCGTVACVETKTDFYPGWRVVRDADAQALGEAGLDVPLIPVSAPLRALAAETGDAALDEESGFDVLVRFLVETVAGASLGRLAGGAAAEVAAVCDQIEGQFEAERTALAGPAQAEQVATGLATAAAAIDELRAAAAPWRRALDDGGAQLISDLDDDLRGRIDRVVEEAGHAIEAGDPADTWPQMPAWLQARIFPDLIDNYALLCQRVEQLADEVGRTFRESTGAAVAFPTITLSGSRAATEADRERISGGGPAMAALRNAYGGALRFTLLGGLTGIVLDPIDVGIALVMGHTGLRDEKERQQLHRRAQAIQAVRRYCDEVILVTGRGWREALGLIQHQLREHHAALAEELHRSNALATDAVTAAQARPESARASRIADLEAELVRVRELRQRAQAVIA